jgi:hypothetical protein
MAWHNSKTFGEAEAGPGLAKGLRAGSRNVMGEGARAEGSEREREPKAQPYRNIKMAEGPTRKVPKRIQTRARVILLTNYVGD